jgi:predicted nucleic acid-binding protein
MTLDNLPIQSAVFIDSNVLVYYFTSDVVLGASCSRLIARVSQQEIVALCSTHILSEVAHRLMTIEAAAKFGWTSKVVQRLKATPAKVQSLSDFRAAIDGVPALGIRILKIEPNLVSAAAQISQQYGLLSNDALTVSVMQANGLTNLASHDMDFDRVPGITRYGPA